MKQLSVALAVFLLVLPLVTPMTVVHAEDLDIGPALAGTGAAGTTIYSRRKRQK